VANSCQVHRKLQQATWTPRCGCHAHHQALRSTLRFPYKRPGQAKPTRALANAKATTARIPRPGRPLGLIIPLAKCPVDRRSQASRAVQVSRSGNLPWLPIWQPAFTRIPSLCNTCTPPAVYSAAPAEQLRSPARHKAAQAHGDDGRLAAASHHHVSIAIPDVVGSCMTKWAIATQAGRDSMIKIATLHAQHNVINKSTSWSQRHGKPCMPGSGNSNSAAHPTRRHSWRWRRQWRWSSWGP